MSLTINTQEPNMMALLSVLHSAQIREGTDLLSYLDAAAHADSQTLPFHQTSTLKSFAQMLDNAAHGKPIDIFESLALHKSQALHGYCDHGEEEVICAEMLKASLDIVPNQSKDPIALFVAELFPRLQVNFIREGVFRDEQDMDLSFHAWANNLVSVIRMIVAGTPISDLEHKQLLAILIQTMGGLLTDMNRNSSPDPTSSQVHNALAQEGCHVEHEDVLCRLAATAFESVEQGYPALESQEQFNVLAALMEKSSQKRAALVKNLDLQPPEVLRLIDCAASVQQGKVILVDWSREMGYSAVSHTYGMKVYEVFDCPCASEYRGTHSPRCNPILNCSAIGGQQVGEKEEAITELSTAHKNVVGDILQMCEILLQNHIVTNYVWHDGVCIAQLDASEVEETIKHIGWIYANAFETVIFLHYVGAPMAPIRLDEDLVARWHTRVWTLQEAVLSESRSYCVRLGHNLIGDDGIKKPGQTIAEFKRNLATWYEEETSAVCLLDEDRFLSLLVILIGAMPKSDLESEAGLAQGQSKVTRLTTRLEELIHQDEFITALDGSNSTPPDLHEQISEWLGTSSLGGLLKDEHLLNAWRSCLYTLYGETLTRTALLPDLESALEICSNRESKHEGDRINSILALAEVKDFTADKDEDLEKNTIEFLKRQGKKGLASAIFLTNVTVRVEAQYYNDTGETSASLDANAGMESAIWGYTRNREHTWVPNLSLRLQGPTIAVMGKQLLDVFLDGQVTKDHWQQLEKVSLEVVDNDNLLLSGPWSIVEVKLSFAKETGDGMMTAIGEVEAADNSYESKQPHEHKREEGILHLELFAETWNADALIVRDPISCEKLGNAVFPLEISESVIEGPRYPLLPQHEDCYFYARMEVPTLALLAFPCTDTSHPRHIRALLLEHAELANPVAKLGSLSMERAFHQLLQTSPIAIKSVDTLIIC